MSDLQKTVESDASPSAFNFAVLGQPLSAVADHDVQAQSNPGVHWSARKACAVLKVTSSIINAVVVHPGGEASAEELSHATNELMRRAAILTDAAVTILNIAPDTRNFAGYKNLLRQQAAEVVATQWRMAHSTNKKQLSAEQLTEVFAKIIDVNPLDGDGEMPPYPDGVDAVTAKRVSLMGVAPEIYQAVNSFDYFAPDPHVLVQKGIKHVMQAAEMGVRRLAGVNASDPALTMVAQSIIGKAGSLYATNYRAVARRDVLKMQTQDPDERARNLYIAKNTGLSTEHIDASFHRLVGRMIDLVCQAVPELSNPDTLRPVEDSVPVTGQPVPPQAHKTNQGIAP